MASRIVFLYPHYVLTSSVGALRVDRTDDEVDGDYSTGDLSLREALQQAGTRNKPTTIFFGVNQVTLDAPLVAPDNGGHPVTLLGSKTVRLVPPENGSAIEIPAGRRLQLEGLSFIDAVSTSPTAILENRGALDLRDCLFQKNAVLGGMIKTFDQARTVGQNCLFLDNGAVSPLFYHGDLVVDGRLGELKLYNSLSAGCPVSIGNRGEIHLKFCTVEGRIMNLPAEGVSLELQNCLIGAADERPDDSLESTLGEERIFSNGGNVFRHLENPAGVLKNGDRRISPLGLYRFGGGYNLKPSSPAINHIDGPPPAEMDPPLEDDLFGRPRLAGSAYDAGAIEVTTSLLQALDALNNATSPDENGNGLPDLVEVLIGIDPAEREAPISEIIVLNTLTGAASSPRPSRETRRTEITFHLDERAWFGRLTLQTSTDLKTWTDRPTYIPQGDGFGYQRLPGEGSTEVYAEISGYLWTITGAIDIPGATLYARLQGKIP